MAYDFPTSPTNGQLANGYIWNGYAWAQTAGGGGSGGVTDGDKGDVIVANGGTTWTLDPAVTTSISNKVAKAGDTMSGALTAPSFVLVAGGSLTTAGNYTAVTDPNGGVPFWGGGTTVNTSIYRNTNHLIQPRDGSATWVDINATRMALSATTASTSPTTGALTVAGGVGVGGGLNVGGTLQLHNGTLTMFGAGGGDVNQSIINLSSSGTKYLYNNGLRWTIAGTPVDINSSTASTSPTTGALTVAGGVGVAGQLSVGGAIQMTLNMPLFLYNAGPTNRAYIGTDTNGSMVFVTGVTAPAVRLSVLYTGDVSVPQTTASTSPTTGALTVAGGVGVGGHVRTSGYLYPIAYACRAGASGAYSAQVFNITYDGIGAHIWIDNVDLGRVATAAMLDEAIAHIDVLQARVTELEGRLHHG